MSGAIPVIVGYLLDGLLGDPRWLPHPVRGIGWLIAVGERRLNQGGAAARLVAGAVLTIVVVSLAAGLSWAVVAGASLFHPLAGQAVTALGVGVLLARRSLIEEAGHAVYRPLAAGDLPAARVAVSWVVGRDTASLDESDVARASVETLAENASDGIVAPLFFALVGGLPGIAAYKAVNTLDSMIGHRNERYRYFGRVAARLDDLLNWAPARLTMLAMVAATALTGRNGAAAWRTARTDGSKHSSPNAGWPEAAMAGALGVCLGGRNYYGGRPQTSPLLNPTGRRPIPADIPAAAAVVQVTCHLTLVVGALLRLLF